jgi:hypothetical protein
VLHIVLPEACFAFVFETDASLWHVLSSIVASRMPRHKGRLPMHGEGEKKRVHWGSAPDDVSVKSKSFVPPVRACSIGVAVDARR